jgi:hypothetical protein
MFDNFDTNIQCEESFDEEFGFEWSDRFEEALDYKN